jgi:hypothetical protein
VFGVAGLLPGLEASCCCRLDRFGYFENGKGGRKVQRANEIKDDIKAARKIWFPWWAVLCAIAASTLAAWLFDHFGRLNLMLPTWNCLLVLGFAIAVKWKLRRRVWFWATMTIIAALHVLLILFVPWTNKWVPAIAIAAIDSADLIVVLAILSVVRKFMDRSKTVER